MDNRRKKGRALPWLVTIGMVIVLACMWYSDEIIDKAKDFYYDKTGGSLFGGESTSVISELLSSGKTESETAATATQTSTVTTAQLMETVVREPLVTLKGNGQDRATVLIYLNGSDLETEDGQATLDLKEMVAAGSGGNVNVVVQTLGTKKWKSTYGISNKTSQRYEVNGDGLTLVKDNLGSLSVGDAENLTDFIRWGAQNYPAERYILVLWDHGAGPVYGYGYDDKTGSEDTLTTYEIRKAIADSGVVFDIVGMDCCIMSSLELCCALYDYCDYTVLSEDFESGYGWYYTDWIQLLRENSSVSTLELGQCMVDKTVSVNKRNGQDSILAVIDEAYMKALYNAWVNFAYANEDTLIGTNYSRVKSRRPGGRVSPLLEEKGFFSSAANGDGLDRTSLQEYYLTDILAVAQNVTGEEAELLTSVLSRAVAYMNAYGDSANLTGLCVTLPYGDSRYYSELKEMLTDCGFDSEYITWLQKFVTSEGSSSYYDYDSWDEQWSQDDGWSAYEEYGGDDWLYGLFGGYADEYGYDGDWGFYDDFEQDWGSGWGWSGQ